MEVASTSPDTGQQGGCALARNRDAQALSGTMVRVILPDVPAMIFCHSCARLCASTHGAARLDFLRPFQEDRPV